MAHPIWQDYYVYFDGDWCDISITFNNNIIYAGRAVRTPNADSIAIRINDICADYIKPRPLREIFGINYTTEPTEYTFSISLTDGTTTTTESVAFTNDYSNSSLVSPINLSAPIVDLVPTDTFFAISAKRRIFIELQTKDGEVITYPIPGVTPPTGEQLSSFVNLSAYDNEAFVSIFIDEIGRFKYRVVDGCGYNYVLYYRNALGGIDFLPIAGNVMQSDSYTRHTIGRKYNNSDEGARGIFNYQNDIARVWALHTGWISDEGAQNMHHLLGSTDVLLFDKENTTYHSVNIRNTNCEYKTYKNQGKQLVRYDIEVELAQTLIRR